MIRAVIFDLDGTLVQTEKLKALSYAKATVALCQDQSVTEAQVLEAFKDVVGLSRQEVATQLVERFRLVPKASERMSEFGVSTAWEAFLAVRLRIYDELVADPEVIRQNQWAHNMQLLQTSRAHGCKTALATMSHRETVTRILDILDLHTAFDFIATRDDVQNGKPDPEIYDLVIENLGVPKTESLIIEDSPSGVRAALAAGIRVIAVSTPFTKDGLRNIDELDAEWIVDDPSELNTAVERAFVLSAGEVH